MKLHILHSGILFSQCLLPFTVLSFGLPCSYKNQRFECWYFCLRSMPLTLSATLCTASTLVLINLNISRCIIYLLGWPFKENSFIPDFQEKVSKMRWDRFDFVRWWKKLCISVSRILILECPTFYSIIIWVVHIRTYDFNVDIPVFTQCC